MAQTAAGDIRVVDVDDRTSWPSTISDQVAEWIEHAPADVEHSDELDLPANAEAAMRTHLNGYRIRVYHCTRLLPHEVQTIETVGLRPLTPALIADRLDAAAAHGCLTADEREWLGANDVYTLRNSHGRANRVCLTSPRSLFDHYASGARPLLSTWGGEAIYWGAERNPAIIERLRTVGRPSIVVVNLDLSAAAVNVHPGLSPLFVAVALALERPGADIFYKGPVPAANIVGIWQPGNPEYDRHTKLPRA